MIKREIIIATGIVWPISSDKWKVSGLVRNQHQFCPRRIDLTPTNYFLRPETRHRSDQSSLYDAFPSQARDQCFTRLAKMRRNTILHSRNYDGNGCKLSAQRFLGSFGWATVTYYWLMVALNTIHQS